MDTPVCKYFLEGCCRFGDFCKDRHTLNFENHVVLVIAPMELDVNGVNVPMFNKLTGLVIGIEVPRNHMSTDQSHYIEVLNYIIENGYHISSVNVSGLNLMVHLTL